MILRMDELEKRWAAGMGKWETKQTKQTSEASNWRN